MSMSAPTSSRGLAALFSPGSVAVIGASDDRERLSGRPIRYLLDAGYAGAIYPVNPKRATVQGLKAYASVTELPQAPDVALIVVAGAFVKQAVLDCIARGVRGVYLLTGGFAESGADGERAQAEIQAIAAEAGVRMLGPNCLGAFNAGTRFFGTFATSLERGLPAAGPLAIVSQSGAYGQHLAYLARRRGLGVGYLISTGNEIDVELGECIEWLAGVPEVGVILAYAEGIRDGRGLARALEAARRARKPVVFLKVGTSEAGARAAASHTAALAGTDAVYDGMLKQFGAWRAQSIEEHLDIGYACARGMPLARGRIGLVSVSGGGGVHMADVAERCALDVAPMNPATTARLAAVLPMGGTGNPIDVTGQAVNEPALLSNALDVVGKSGEYDALVVFLTTVPLALSIDAPVRRAILESTTRFREDGVVVVSMVADEASVQAYEAEGCLVFEDPARAVRAVGALHAFSKSFDRVRADADGKKSAMDGPLSQRLGQRGRTLSEVDAKALLRDAGIASLPETLVQSAEQAAAAASAHDAVAMKIVSAGILHKTEIGGVMLGVAPSEAAASYATLRERAADAHPDAEIDGVLVTPMAPRGVEVILGAVNDPTFGPVVMFGMGGVMAEAFGDITFRLAPIDAAEARRMIASTRADRILQGWRGAPPADVDALVDALCGLSRLAADMGDQLETIDVNPLLVLPAGQGAVALDAVVITRDGVASPQPAEARAA